MATTLSKKAKDTFAVLFFIGLLAVGGSIGTAKAENPPNESAIQTVALPSEHNVLAENLEETALQMQAKVDAQKKLLEQYEEMHLYGWQSHNLKSQTTALIRKYQQAARANMEEAMAQRQMAQQPKPNYAIHGGQKPQTGSN